MPAVGISEHDPAARVMRPGAFEPGEVKAVRSQLNDTGPRYSSMPWLAGLIGSFCDAGPRFPNAGCTVSRSSPTATPANELARSLIVPERPSVPSGSPIPAPSHPEPTAQARTTGQHPMVALIATAACMRHSIQAISAAHQRAITCRAHR